MTARPTLDPAVVSGLIAEYGDDARSRTYERRWERDAATWRAVVQALKDAADGRRPAAERPRPPAWLASLVRSRLEMLATRWSRDAAFDVIRTLEHVGLVTLEPDDTYVLAAVGGVGGRFTSGRAESLRTDPGLIDKVVWRMFEVEGGGEVSLANIDKYTAGDAGWQATFVELTADGTLPRGRVLTSALSALNRDFSAYRAGWHSRLYDALTPTVDELAHHQPQLRLLLRSNISATVGFALTKLRTLHKHEALDGAETLPAVAPAAVAAPKTTALAAVRLADQIVTRQPDLGADGSAIAAAALAHPHADVQKAAGALLRKLGADHLLQESAEFLEPSVQADLLGERPASPDERRTAAPGHSPAAAKPTAVGETDVLDRLAALLEDAGDPMEVELVLAQLAVLDSPDQLHPLTKRAGAILRRGPREGVTPLWLRGQLARLVLAAAGLDVPDSPAASDPATAFLLKRLGHVETILRRRQPTQPLLATPDHAQGWVTPATLVDRLQQRSDAPEPHDLVAALLRLAADGRAEALNDAGRDAGSLTGPVKDVVHYALGGPPPAAERRRILGTKQLDHRALWVAASRCRYPTGRDEWLVSRGVHGAGRSEPLDATVEFHSHPYSWTERGRTHHSQYWKWAIEITSDARTADEMEPTGVAGGPQGLRLPLDHEDLVGWLAMIWPHDCEHFLVTAIHAVLRAAAFTEVSHDAVRVLNAVATHPGRTGSLTETCLAAGLSAGKADQRTVAVDAVLQRSRAGRLSAEQLAAGLVSFRGPATLTRLAATLRDVAADGAPARNLVIDAIAAALPAFDTKARGIHTLLELVREELLREGRQTPAPMTTWLATFEGGSRASKAAKALLAMS